MKFLIHRNSPKCLNYRIFKEELIFEQYLSKLPLKLALELCKYRTCNMNLPIEKGRWINIPRNERLCQLCNVSEIGDEFHYLFTCQDSTIIYYRNCLIPRYYYIFPNTYKFNKLFNSQNKKLLLKLSKFICIIKERVNSPG